MNWDLFLKYLGYAFVISVYGVFAWTGRAPVEGFIVVLMGVLASLGTSHASDKASKTATAAALGVIVATQGTAPPAAPAPTVVVKS